MEGGFTGMGGAAVYASFVETRMASINGIISKFEADDRDGTLVADAEAPAPRWTADEWAALGTQSREREWIKTDLNAWAERVTERAKATQAAATTSMDDGDDAGATASSAFGSNYKSCVKKLRELGVRMLQLASVSEQRQLSHAEIRQELDDTIVGALAPLSSIVDRGMDARGHNSSRRQIDVPSNDVFRASALQQRLVAKLELQLAEREALLTTVRREADDNYHAWMRAEERIRQVSLLATQKPPQRSRAVECNIAVPSATVAVQVDTGDNDSDDGDAAAVGVPARNSRPGMQADRLATAHRAGARPTNGAAASAPAAKQDKGPTSTRPHEVLILQNKMEQQRFMFVALLALYRKAKLKLRGPATRTRFSQTDGVVALPSDTRRAEQRALDTFANNVMDGLSAADSEGHVGSWSDSVVAAIDAAMLTSPQLDLVDARTRAMSQSSSSRCSSMTPVEAANRLGRTPSARKGVGSSLPSAIGELVGTNVATVRTDDGTHRDVARRVAEFTQSRRGSNSGGTRDDVGTRSAPGAAVNTPARPSEEPHPSVAGAASTPAAVRRAREGAPRWVDSTACQTNRLLLRDEGCQTEALTALPVTDGQEGPPIGGDATSSTLLRCTVAEAPESLLPDGGKADSPTVALKRQATRAYIVQEEPAERYTTPHATPMQPARLPHKTPTALRPFSAHRPTVAKKYTVVAPHDLVLLAGMEARTKSDAMTFSKWRDELIQLKLEDAEAVLISPRVDGSSHHFPPTASERCGTAPSHLPRRAADRHTHNGPPTDGLPATAILTQQGVDDKRVPSRPVSPAATSRGRPQPLVVPRVW